MSAVRDLCSSISFERAYIIMKKRLTDKFHAASESCFHVLNLLSGFGGTVLL